MNEGFCGMKNDSDSFVFSTSGDLTTGRKQTREQGMYEFNDANGIVSW